MYAVFPFSHTYWSIEMYLEYGDLEVRADVWAVEAHFGYPVIYSTI